MKYLLLLFILLLTGLPAGAQTPRPAARPDSLGAAQPTPSAAPDTVAALHQLFAAKRKRNLSGLAGIAVFGTAGVALSGELNGEGIANSRNMASFFILLLSIPTAAVLTTSYVLSYKKERRVIKDLQAHQLSSGLKNQLKDGRFFRE